MLYTIIFLLYFLYKFDLFKTYSHLYKHTNMTRNRGNKKTNEKEYYKSGNHKRTRRDNEQNNTVNFTRDLGRSIISEIDVTVTNSNTGEIIVHDYYNSNHHNELSNFYNAFTNTGITTNPPMSRNTSIRRNVGFSTSLPTTIPITMFYVNGPNILNENRYLPPLPTTYFNTSPNGAYNYFTSDNDILTTTETNNELSDVIDKLAAELFNHSTDLTDNDYKQMMDILKDVKNNQTTIGNIELGIYNKITNFINTYITNEDDIVLFYSYFR